MTPDGSLAAHPLARNLPLTLQASLAMVSKPRGYFRSM